MSDEDKKLSQEDDLTLRDKLAAAALPALMARFAQKVDDSWVTNEWTATADFKRDIATIARLAYQIADEMRKARLQSFT